MAKEKKFNPYLPEQNGGNYENAPMYTTDLSRASFSFSHPYSSAAQALEAIQPGQPGDKVYSKLHDQVRRNQEAMLTLIAKDDRAFVYAHPDLLRDEKFKEEALRANPKVYDHLSQADRDNPSIANVYYESMEARMRRDMIWRNTPGMNFPHRFSEMTNPDLVFTAERYMQNYKRLLEHGAIDRNGVVAKEAMALAADRAINQNPSQSRDEIERTALAQYIQKDKNMLQVLDIEKDARARDLKEAIDRRFEGHSQEQEMQLQVKKSQEKMWEARRQEMVELMRRQQAGETLEQGERDTLQRAQRHLQFTEEERKGITRRQNERVQQQRTEDMRYAQIAATDQARAMEERGQMTHGEANDTIGYVTNGPSVVGAGSAAANAREAITAKVNDSYDDPTLQHTAAGTPVEPYTTKEEKEIEEALIAKHDAQAMYLYEHDGFGHEADGFGYEADGHGVVEEEKAYQDRQEEHHIPSWAMSPELQEEMVPVYNPFKP